MNLFLAGAKLDLAGLVADRLFNRELSLSRFPIGDVLVGFLEGDAELVLKVETPEGDFFGEGTVVFFGD